MTWFKIDDGFHSHPKMFDASDAAVALWTRAGSWAAQNLTDGFVPSTLPARLCDDPGKATEELIRRGMWTRTRGGFQFHDWLEYNPSKEKVLADRAKDAEKKRKARAALAKKRRTANARPPANPAGVPRESPGDAPGESPSTRPGVPHSSGPPGGRAGPDGPPADPDVAPSDPRALTDEQLETNRRGIAAVREQMRNRPRPDRGQPRCPDCHDRDWVLGPAGQPVHPPTRCDHPTVSTSRNPEKVSA
ncbi:hypothetical protein ACL02T_33095 [Pseudonocardia sp. RS010]|uniref:hypothetical protein n=1 Tax=Pseudonocardia sp. RS010 TaxID=3385979 RepID=UPI0039A32C98